MPLIVQMPVASLRTLDDAVDAFVAARSAAAAWPARTSDNVRKTLVTVVSQFRPGTELFAVVTTDEGACPSTFSVFRRDDDRWTRTQE